MTLRRRLMIAAAATAGLVALLAVVVSVSFLLTSSSQRTLFDTLAPAADDSTALVLAQTEASTALADHLILASDDSLVAYGSAVAAADALLADLDTVITDDLVELSAAWRAADDTQERWIAVDAKPVLAMIADDRQARAARVYSSKEAWSAYEAMIEASRDLATGVDAVRAQAATDVSGFTTRLGLTLLAVALAVVLGALGLMVAVRQWILLPLAHVRRDLRRAARSDHHLEPIAVDGPPEIAAVATDAEGLRRALVTEIDEAVAAREGLLQDAPLAAAMRAEMQGPQAYACDFAEVSGLSLAAEGVIAGDWWDIIERPGGSFTLVLADASGHGPQAGIAALRVRTVLRSALEAGLDLAQAAQMGARACDRDEHFVTALLVEITREGALHWVNAGHHPALIVTEDKQSAILAATGPLLSGLGGQWSISSTHLGAGDLVLCFTDGLVEARTPDGDELGTTDLETYLRGLDGHVRCDAAETAQRVVAHARSRTDNLRRDDVTIVATCYHG